MHALPEHMRGAVLTQYTNETWSHHRGEANDEPEPLVPPPGKRFVKQQITIGPLDEPVVFSVYPAYAVDSDIPVRYQVARQRGSHIRPRDESDPDHRPLTVPDDKVLKPGLLRKLLRDANLTVGEFVDLLK